jgi:hypothetical protein
MPHGNFSHPILATISRTHSRHSSSSRILCPTLYQGTNDTRRVVSTFCCWHIILSSGHLCASSSLSMSPERSDPGSASRRWRSLTALASNFMRSFTFLSSAAGAWSVSVFLFAKVIVAHVLYIRQRIMGQLPTWWYNTEYIWRGGQ